MGGKAVIGVMAFVRRLFASDFLPERFAGRPVQAEQHELVRFRRLLGAHSTSASGPAARGRRLSRRVSQTGDLGLGKIRLGILFVNDYRCFNEDLVPPDNGSGS